MRLRVASLHLPSSFLSHSRPTEGRNHRSTRASVGVPQVRADMRKRKMGSQLVKLAVRGMRDGGCDEAVLETEVTNIGALRLYEGLGFVR